MNNDEIQQWRDGQLYFIPSILVILLSYCLGIYLFINTFCTFAECPDNRQVIFIKQLFFMGILGGAMHCHLFLAKEFNQYHKSQSPLRTPFLTDFLGYIMQIIGAGITSVILFFALKAGLIVVTSGSVNGVTQPDATASYAAWLIAFVGGMGTHHVKGFIDKFGQSSTGTRGRWGNEDEKPGESKH
ncbi:hypothetical protein [Rheinheimera aquimaris]|uniref:hypothetical protein n=1 Tax=Rheinheimera aquimaris TaxID=412437 RepID=UPI001064B6E7|nr:hypothetical protein [Rheinheimera aquimaris]